MVATLTIHLKRSLRQRSTLRRYNVAALRDQQVSDCFQLEVSNRFATLANDQPTSWEIFRDTLQVSASQVLGFKPPIKKEWISDTTRELVDWKHSARLQGDHNQYKTLCKETKRQVRKDHRNWAENLAIVGEQRLQSGQVKDAFANFRQLRSATQRFSSPLLDSSGTLISDSKGKSELWKSYYSNLLNRHPAPSSSELIDAAANATPVTTISCDPPTKAEIQRSISKMKSGHAAGICGISAELLKAGGECVANRLTEVIHQAWECGTAPDDWKKGIILPFYKNKGARSECKNYRGITLLSIPGKVYAHTVRSRAKKHLQMIRRWEQSGFTPRRSTIDRIATLKLTLGNS